uniref:NHL repeat-containing protein 2 n=1 Tax=Aegilops tauschii subsp. strangulata TaxID=200361 RepID=A0A453RZW9_AEGTS
SCGKNHCWLNAVNGIWKTFNQEGIYLVLLYQSHETLDGDSKHSAAFRKLKYLHQRYPHLNVFAMQYGSGISSLATQSQAVRTIMEEYITFPILLSDKDFTNMANGACYLLFEGSKDHIIFTKLDGDPELMIRGMEGFSALSAEPIENVVESGVPWQKEEVVKEPYVGSLRNLLLYHPGGLSIDEDGDRIFISDSNHHRIIISNGDGVILDCIGSSPGFEDGEFESAKLLHPAASFYHAAEDCLYIVDSENHAVRKADFGRRFLETVYPVFNKKGSGVWSWIIDKLGLTKEDASKKDDTSNIQDFDADSVVFPWHLLKISEDDLLVADRSFETSWILSMSTGEKKNIVRDGQRVQKHDLDTKETSNIHFTNVGVLGLPYWFVCRLEKVSTWGHSAGQFQDHNRKVNVLPGRCNIKVSVDIPVDTELATPLVESCIWRQVRGSGAGISESDAQDTTSEKVGIAQQWYDEIDNLAFSEAAEEPAVIKGDDKPADESHQDQKSVHFTCAVNVSPGSCELVASAALYLRVDRTKADHEDQKAVIKRILQCQGHEEHVGVELLTENHRDARDLVIMKPVHLRLRMECADHPAGTTNKETISTESSLEISITLE